MTKHIFVLAGGIDNIGNIYDFVKKRLDKAISIYNINDYIYCIGGGTYHKQPTLNKDMFVIHESTACAKYLIMNNINENNILKECSSYDTIANGFYSFMNYIIPLKIREIILITSKFHMKRVKLIFNYINSLSGQNINIIYIETPDELEEEILKIRSHRENNSSKLFTNNIVEKYNTIEAFTLWLYTKHKSYKALVDYNLDSNTDINKTY